MSDARKLGLLIVVMSALRVVAAVSFPMTAGEAYYWLWGRHLAAGYFDHPPMVGLMSALFFGWLHGSELAARSGPIVLGALTTLAVYALGREIFRGGRTAWRAAALFTLTPLFDLSGVLVQPDNSLILFMTLTWLLFWRAVQREGSPWLWAAAGATAGLALLSKFHAWVLLPPLWGFLALSPPQRRLLKTPGPWLAAGAALAVLSPNLVWNARHDWLNYAFQWRRSHLSEGGFEIKNVVQYMLMPALSVSPLVYAALVWGAWKALRALRAAPEPRFLYLLCAGLPLPLFLGALSFAVTISPHWPSCGYVALMVLAVGLLEEGAMFGPRYYPAMLGVAAAMTACLHVAPYFVLRLPDDVRYPWLPNLANTSRLKSEYLGWGEIGEKAREIRDTMNGQAPTVIMAKDWHMAGMLAFYSERPGEVFALEGDAGHNFELWRRERGGLAGCNAVVVLKKEDPNYPHKRLTTKYDKYYRYLDPLFESVEPAPPERVSDLQVPGVQGAAGGRVEAVGDSAAPGSRRDQEDLWDL